VPAGDERAFNSLLAALEREMSFEADFYDDAYLGRRIAARMRRSGHDSYREYQQLLESDEQERRQLLDSLSIPVTAFFRDPEAWETLRTVLGQLTNTTDRVQVWSAPCSDGREPYSLAMLALDDGAVDADRIEILGTDINPDVLETARTGVYVNTHTSDIASELDFLDEPSRYVDCTEGVFRVREKVKERVSFEQHDLIGGEPKHAFDLVLCRNLLIYMDTSYKPAVVETVRDSLREGGYLMTGMTETLPVSCRDDFEPVSKRHRIYRRL